jgi:hypothetical protein
MIVDEGRYLPGLVAVVKGIFYSLDGYDRILFYFSDDKIGAAAKCSRTALSNPRLSLADMAIRLFMVNPFLSVV